jgi:signal transduction histidine kinase
MELLRAISQIIIEPSNVARVEWWLKEGEGYFRCEVTRKPTGETRWQADNLDMVQPDQGIMVGTRLQAALDPTYLAWLRGELRVQDGAETTSGSLWICSECHRPGPVPGVPDRMPGHPGGSDPNLPCRMFIPLRGEGDELGFFTLSAEPGAHFTEGELEFHDLAAEAVAIALVHQDIQFTLQERVKELRCLYDVVQLAAEPGSTLAEILQGVAEVLPPAWQFPDKAAGRVILDGHTFQSRGFVETPQMQSASIVVGGEERGSIDVVYLEKRPGLAETLFLKEERHLITALAREVSGIIERRQAQEETARLEDQLRHAERLATIGQLAAGVAHELNEPLNYILGFAELAQKADGLPEQARRDIGKIVDACLFSRTVVSKLKLFARQMPAERTRVDLHEMITDELFFMEGRCAKEGVRIERDLQPRLPEILADRGQVFQILVNLVVNALQAMPNGGVLTLRTRRDGDDVLLSVEDTGEGMDTDTLAKIFEPFFTTKDIDQGTGLGLSVIQGIVAAHGGSIQADSALGEGATFTVRLPIEGALDPPEGTAQ